MDGHRGEEGEKWPDSGCIFKVEAMEIADGLDDVKVEEGSRIPPKFGMSATEMGNSRKGIHPGRNIESLSWHMSILGIQMEVCLGAACLGEGQLQTDFRTTTCG